MFFLSINTLRLAWRMHGCNSDCLSAPQNLMYGAHCLSPQPGDLEQQSHTTEAVLEVTLLQLPATCKNSGSAYSLPLKTALEVWTPVYYVILSPCSETAWAGLSCVRFQWLQAPNLPLCACRAHQDEAHAMSAPTGLGTKPTSEMFKETVTALKTFSREGRIPHTAVWQSLPIGTLIWSKIYVYILSCKGWSQLNIAYERKMQCRVLAEPCTGVLLKLWTSTQRWSDPTLLSEFSSAKVGTYFCQEHEICSNSGVQEKAGLRPLLL